MWSERSSAVGRGVRTATAGGRRFVRGLADVERWLWGLLVAALLVDVALTYYGLETGLREGNPAMRIAIEAAGIAALLAAKLAVVGVGAATRRLLGERGAVVPLGLALPWVAAATVNAVLLL